MKQFTRVFFSVLFGFVLGLSSANAAVKNWINTSGGNYFDPASWSPAGVPTANDSVTITNNGTYTVLASTGLVSSAVFTIGGASGKQTFCYGSSAGFATLLVTNTTVQANGVLMVTNWGIAGGMTVQPGGELVFYTPNAGGLQMYSLSLTNQGTVTFSNCCSKTPA